MKSETVERHFTFTQNNIFPIIQEDDSCSLKNMLQTVAKDAVCPTCPEQSLSTEIRTSTYKPVGGCCLIFIR